MKLVVDCQLPWTQPTVTHCVKRNGALRRIVLGANGWRGSRDAPLRKGNPPFGYIRAFWAPILCKPPWEKFVSIEHCMRSDQCFACGRGGTRMQAAHILPRWSGGGNRPNNLHMLCRICHDKSEELIGMEYWRWFKHRTASVAIVEGAVMQLYSTLGEDLAIKLVPLFLNRRTSEPSIRGLATAYANYTKSGYPPPICCELIKLRYPA